jgi:hypothetical protein
VDSNPYRTTLEVSPPLSAKSKCREQGKRRRRWSSHQVESKAPHVHPPCGLSHDSKAARTLG